MGARVFFDLRQQAKDAFKHLQTSASLPNRGHHCPKMEELDHQSSYVVTGGTGALGLLLGQWLLDRGAGHVVLLSRSGTPSSTKAWADLEAQQETRVVVKKCDVADQLAVRSILLEIHHRTAPVKGVMHAAGVLRDALLADQTDHAFDEVWQPKAAGAMNLHNTVVNDLGSRLDLFVMFSSVTALLGNAGQANYAAANAVLDALAARRRSVGLWDQHPVGGMDRVGDGGGRGGGQPDVVAGDAGDQERRGAGRAGRVRGSWAARGARGGSCGWVG